ncbi:MAG TPA: matrixin family metalloprotease [Iamia sp.]|nr:matrixin family metalloprotease [Iamia sp.]
MVTRTDDEPAASPPPEPGRSEEASGPTSSAPSFLLDGTRYAFPTPAPDADEPLGAPPADVDPAAPHVFTRTQEGTDDPVTWDPCRPLAVVVDDRTEPDGGARLLTEALAQVARATGLQIDDEGPTDEAPAEHRAPVQEDRYGDRWAPILIAWSDPEASPALAGDVGGQGGGVAVRRDDASPFAYVTGTLVLDGPQMQESLAVRGGSDQVRSVILHELAHVVGLGHVEDPTELMYPEGQPGVTTFGPGDRAGLARLGQGPCLADL